MRRAGFLSVVALALAGCSEAPKTCDRACLITLTDNYIAGLVAHSAAALPVADDLIFVEDLKRTAPGEGLWQSATAGPGDFSIHVPDEARQSAGWIGVMEKDGEPALVAIRLKLDDGKIVEAEHLTTTIRPENMERLQTPRPGLVSMIAQSDRLDHDALMRIGASYYDALDENDGTLMPFAQDCERHENGMITAGPGPVAPGPNSAGSAPIARDCAGQLSSNVMAYITRIENRRVFAADPVTGLVMGLSHFRHPMDFEPYLVTALDGSSVTYDKDRFGFEPFDLPAAHVFKIGADQKVHEIEAMGFMAPYDAPTGWE